MGWALYLQTSLFQVKWGTSKTKQEPTEPAFSWEQYSISLISVITGLISCPCRIMNSVFY